MRPDREHAFYLPFATALRDGYDLPVCSPH